MKNKKLKYVLSLCLLLLCIMGWQETDYASQQFEVKNQEAFCVPIIVESEKPMDTCDIQITYDSKMLTYLDGATSVEDGILHIEQALKEGENHFNIAFQAAAGGDTNIQTKIAELNQSSEISVFIKADSNALLDGITINGEKVKEFDPETLSYQVEVSSNCSNLDIGTESNCSVAVSDTSLKEEQQKIYITVTGENQASNIYTLLVCKKDVSINNNDSESNVSGTEEKELQFPRILFGAGIFLLCVVLVVVLWFVYMKKHKQISKNTKTNRKEYSTEKRQVPVKDMVKETKDDHNELKKMVSQAMKKTQTDEVNKSNDSNDGSATDTNMIDIAKINEEIERRMNEDKS